MAHSLSQIDVALHRDSGVGAAYQAAERWLETERERIGLWLPVALGTGIAAWFALPNQGAWAGWIALCCLLALAALALPRGGRLRAVAAGLGLLAAAGCVLIWAKALIVGEPPLARPLFTTVEVRVLAVEAQPALDRFRLLVEPSRQHNELPSRMRVNVAAADMPDRAGPGALLSFRARLMPPAPPAVPGAYDFASRAYFMGIGATGRALPPIRVVAPGDDRGSGLRRRLADHITGRLGEGGEGAIAVTLATGDRGGISEEDAEAMRRSGLAHLLSISGLHVSALIAAVILLVYRLLALSPRLALTLPLLLVAAGAGAAAGIAYTLFTGAEVPTVRSCIAALLVLGGLALGRDAISLRLIAAGALVILIFWPDALAGPSFQMSFAAVTMIVALAEAQWFRRLTHARDEARLLRLARSLMALFIVGVVIELALMPIAMFHFHQAGILGAFANLIAIPLTSFIVMPAEALAIALDAVGLGAPLWWIVGHALGLLLTVAHGVASHPFAVWLLPWFSGGELAAVILGGLWLVIWRTRARLLGVPVMLAGGLSMLLAPVPDLLVTGDGRHMAVRQPDGRFALLRGRAGDYVRDTLAASAGEGEGLGRDMGGGQGGMAALIDTADARCSRDFCAVAVRGRGRDWMILATRSDMRVPWRALIDTCARADIVVSDRRLPAACAPRWLKLDRSRLSITGGVAVYLDRGTWNAVLRPGDGHPWIVHPRG